MASSWKSHAHFSWGYFKCKMAYHTKQIHRQCTRVLHTYFLVPSLYHREDSSYWKKLAAIWQIFHCTDSSFHLSFWMVFIEFPRNIFNFCFCRQIWHCLETKCIGRLKVRGCTMSEIHNRITFLSTDWITPGPRILRFWDLKKNRINWILH